MIIEHAYNIFKASSNNLYGLSNIFLSTHIMF